MPSPSKRRRGGRLGRLLDTARTLWDAGAFRDPLELARQLRHREALAGMQTAFIQQRFATAAMLGERLGVYDALRDNPATPAELARKCDLLPQAADALLRIFDSQGFVERRGERYQLSSFASIYLTSGSRSSLAPSLALLAAQAASFEAICRGLRDGTVPPRLDVTSADGDHIAFLDAVNAYLGWAAVELLRKAELPPIRDFIVGSMGVSFSARVLERFGEARVTYGCLPKLVREIPRLREIYRVPAERVTGMHDHGGDPRDDRWGDEAYDLVLLTKKMILAPEERTGERFAQKAFEVLRPGGVVVLWEAVHEEPGPTPLGRAMEALLDLAASPTAKPHTEASLRRLLGAIGFESMQVIGCLDQQTTFVVARKPRR